jgi:hypothetical protein
MNSMFGAALAGATLLASLSLASAAETGYLDAAGAPLVPTPHYAAGDAQATPPRQEASGYFATAGEPLVVPHANTPDAATTLAKQRESGYFPEAGAPDTYTPVR